MERTKQNGNDDPSAYRSNLIVLYLDMASACTDYFKNTHFLSDLLLGEKDIKCKQMYVIFTFHTHLLWKLHNFVGWKQKHTQNKKQMGLS